MTRSHRISRTALGALVTTLGVSILIGANGATLLAADAAAEGAAAAVKGKTPKALKAIDLTFHGDAAESGQAGAALPKFGDFVAVGIGFEQGNSKTRGKLIKQAGKKDNTIGQATKTGKKDQVVYVVANLAAGIPKKLSSDVVLVVGADGSNPVPYSPSHQDSLTQGAAFAHVIGRYGSQQGAPWLTGDDSVAGDAPATPIDFQLPGTGAGGYDAKSKSIYTSFILPPDARNLSVALYTTEGGAVQVDTLEGPAHLYRIPIAKPANQVTCAKIDIFGRHDASGSPTGIFDVRATLVEPVDGARPSDVYPLVFEPVGGRAGAPPTEALPESPPGSGTTYWYGVVDTGSPDGGVVGITSPGTANWGMPADLPPPAVANAFGGVRIQAGTEGGTAFGDPLCGNVFAIEGCAHGGGSGFWSDFVEANGLPRPEGVLQEFPYAAPLGTAYCVVVEEGLEEPYLLFGIEPRPFTLDGHVRDMEANPCDQTPVDLGLGGVVATCPNGTTTFRWLETGVDPETGAAPDWGFRPEVTFLPPGRDALSWGDATELTPESLEVIRQEALRQLAEAGWTGDEDGFDFAADPDRTARDIITGE